MKAINAMDAMDGTLRDGGSFRRMICRCDGVHFEAALLSRGLPLPVPRQAPDDSCQIGALVLDFVPYPLPVETEEAFLHHIVGVAAIAQKRPGDAKGEAHVPFDEGLEGDFVGA